MRTGFRSWVIVLHRFSGCLLPLAHIDWQVDWQFVVGPAPPGQHPTSSMVQFAKNESVVTDANGDGSPLFLIGSPVFAQLDHSKITTCEV